MATEIVTLKQICTELKLDPREARERLRTAVKDTKKYPDLAKTHKPRMPCNGQKDRLRRSRCACSSRSDTSVNLT